MIDAMQAALDSLTYDHDQARAKLLDEKLDANLNERAIRFAPAVAEFKTKIVNT